MAKKIPEGIDSLAILNAIRPDSPPPPSLKQPSAKSVEQEPKPPMPKARQTKRRKKEVVVSEFEQSYIRRSELSARSGKLVYIRQEYHERINKIIRVIGKDKISMFEYIDNILTEHFEQYEEQITKLYDEKLEGVY